MVGAVRVDRAVVTDEEIKAAQMSLWDHLPIVVEPGGAAALAAVLFEKYRPRPNERIGVVLCGANTTAVEFS